MFKSLVWNFVLIISTEQLSSGERGLFVDFGSLKTGDKLKMGEVEIQLTGPTAPCKTIQNSFTNNQFSRISQKKNPGWSRWYAKVLKEGTVKLNDNVAFFPI